MTNEERYAQAHCTAVESLCPCGGELGHLISEVQHPEVEDAFAELAPNKPAPITIRMCTMPDEAGQ